MKLADRFVDLATRPVPLRTLFFRKLLQRFPIGSWEARVRAGAVQRPHYAICLRNAAWLAQRLGYRAITVVEFGVAGGSGLVCLCDYAAEVRRAFGVELRVVGFDSGEGLPETHDLRDVHYMWPAGSFEMDSGALKARLKGRAELVLGNVADTVPRWQPAADAPLGAVMFDLDLYSSTRDALQVLTKENVLPRVWCYFDDMTGSQETALTDFIGESAAIREFNDDPARRTMRDNLARARVFKSAAPESWHERIYLYHRLLHPQYDLCLSAEKHQLELAAS
ncbi:MAG TPA: hypothetical protein VMD25_00835 [Acidobacteriaceae bacterium]|nr:hypothetical protein [Acidobacteriaceae bacterium]